MMWPHEGHAESWKSKSSSARALRSSATDRTSTAGRLGMLEAMLAAGSALRSGERPGDTALMTEATSLPLVEQLRFTRSEFRRGLRGTPEQDAVRRLEPMNSIGWIVAHMAWHEQRYWLTRGLGETPRPELNEIAANGGPATTPPLRAMLDAWMAV